MALRKLILEAKTNHQKIAVIGAGLSQGKQFLPPDEHSLAINMKRFNTVHVNPDTKTATVGAGGTWGVPVRRCEVLTYSVIYYLTMTIKEIKIPNFLHKYYLGKLCHVTLQ